MVRKLIGDGDGKGDVQIQGRRILLTNNVRLSNQVTGSIEGGDISLYGSESIQIENGSEIISQVEPGATANGGALTLHTDQLLIANRSDVVIATHGEGKGGNINIKS